MYANVVQITTGPFDLVMDFGFKTPEQIQRGSTEYESLEPELTVISES